MKIGPIVLKLRLANITLLGNRIGGAAQFDLATQGTLMGDSAFVIPMSEDAGDSDQDSGVVQGVDEKFSVVVAIQNDTDEGDQTGLISYDKLDDVRDGLIRELVGLDLGYSGPIYYAGGKLLAVDPSYLWYEYDFGFKMTIGTDDSGYGYIEERNVEDRRNVAELDDFNKIATQYVLHPGTKWEDIKEIMRQDGIHLPLAATMPDMSTWIDMSQPYKGSFNAAYLIGFDTVRLKK